MGKKLDSQLYPSPAVLEAKARISYAFSFLFRSTRDSSLFYPKFFQPRFSNLFPTYSATILDSRLRAS
ncbi:hypothetical protein PGTUg99_012081 [Puccinia graminis f. sp. tritici]|uniref:Uncharacterized protein n=1 Tax=Puccinia graminis f. sp. tritici TaxID=56615 RepID=A0A5B0QGX0_PUCGR|nr:hypothetical protein PGTUg99_012081 [Puccinia graminis f. sp. tritici]